MSGRAVLDHDSRVVYDHLREMFPQLTDEIIIRSIQDPDNRRGQIDAFILLDRCMDDLLRLQARNTGLDLPKLLPATYSLQ